MRRTLEVVLIGDAKSVERAFGKARNATDDYTKKVDEGKGIITRASAIGAAAIGGLAVASVNAAGDFEKSLNIFQATTGATGDEMDRVSELAKKLGNDVKLPGTSAKDAADAMTELAKGGLSVRESMDAARGVLQLSAAAEIDNAQAATIAARALNTFGLAGKEATRVSDILAATANASTAEITDVAAGFQMAGASAAQLGIPIEDLSTAIGIMANKGIAGSDAGTSLKTMFTRLVPQTDKAAEAMKKLGVDVFDADGEFIGIRGAIEQYRSALGKLNPEQRQAAINTIFGSDAQRAANIVLMGGTKQFDKMKESVTKTGAAQAMAEAKTKGFKGSLEAFVSTVETLAIEFGEVLLPAATSVMRFLAGAFGKFGEHKTLVLALTAAIGALATVVLTVSAAIKVHTAVTAAWAAITATSTAVAGGFTTAWWALNFAVAANPIGAVIVAITAFVAALVLAWKHSETFREIVTDAWRTIKSVTEAVWGAVSGFLVGLWEGLKQFVTGYFNGYKNVILTAWRTVRDVGKAIWDGISGFLSGVWNAIKATANVAWDGIRFVIVNPVRGAVNVIRDVVGGVIGFLAGAWETIKGAANAAWDAFKRFIVNPVKDAVEAVKNALGGDGLLGWLRDRFEDFKNVAEKIAKPFIDVFGKVKDLLGKIIDFLGDIIKAAKDAAGFIGKIKPPDITPWDGLSPFGGKGGGNVGPGRGGTLPSHVSGFNDDAARFGLQVTSGYRPGDDGYHGLDRARDYSNGTGPTPGMLAFARYMATNFGLQLKELIHTPLGFGIKNGGRVPLSFWGSAVNAQHNNHVHVALAQGGIARQPVRARVGEFGPEDVYLPQGARVVPNHETRRSEGVVVNIGEYHAHGRRDAEIVANKLAHRVAFA